jgi:hypothetical protein
MKIDLTTRPALLFFAAIAACATAVYSPAGAFAADSASSAGEAGGDQARTATVEQRIALLRDQLKITPDQEAQWSQVAQVMRDNASTIDQTIKARVRNAARMNAVDDLLSYQAIAAAHADGLKKLATAFQALYSKMPEAQQKNADAVFEHRTTASKLRAHS